MDHIYKENGVKSSYSAYVSRQALTAVTYSLESLNGFSFEIVLSGRIWLPGFSNNFNVKIDI